MSDVTTEQRFHFNDVAGLYDAARPGYPALLFDDIVLLAHVPQRASVLDVGCGTGKSTEPLARMGYDITVLDPGEHMLELCRQNLRAYPNVTYECSLFESWDPKGRLFDLIISGTAFHWIPTEAQRKLSTLLNSEGAIAIFWHTYLNGPDEVYSRFDDIYKAHSPENYVADFHATQEMFDRRREAEMLSLPGLHNWRVIRYYQTLLLDAPRYINLMKTWSTHRASQESLFSAVADAIERSGGRISKPVRTTLCLAQRAKSL